MRECCRICEQLQFDQTDLEANPWNTILFESPNFVVMPTLGAIVEGWTLIVSKKHYLCMGALEENFSPELTELTNFISRALTECYGQVANFEHGPSQPKQLVGCGVDHAHLHVVPIEKNLIKGVESIFKKHLIWNKVNNLKDAADYYDKGVPYLYVDQPTSGAFLTTDSEIPSQLFRKVISFYSGQPDRYNWRSFPEKENVIATINTIENWKIKNGIETFIQPAGVI